MNNHELERKNTKKHQVEQSYKKQSGNNGIPLYKTMSSIHGILSLNCVFFSKCSLRLFTSLLKVLDQKSMKNTLV